MSIKKKLDEDKFVPADWAHIWDDVTNSTYVGLPPENDHAKRMRAAAAELDRRAKESEAAVHEAEVDASWWSGVICGCIFTVAALIITLITRVWIG